LLDLHLRNSDSQGALAFFCAGGFGWRMTDDEVAALDAASDKVPESTGAPFEKW